jgi:uncharacterized membrane protein YkoI
MSAPRIFLSIALAASALAGSGESWAADPMRCLGTDQRRAAIAAHKAIPLGRAFRAVHSRHGSDVVRARLCETASGLVYVLTLLARDGKVTRVTLEAGSGRVLGRR